VKPEAAGWWKSITESKLTSASLLQCVFCGLDSSELIRDAIQQRRHGSSMMAWWTEGARENNTIGATVFAAGLYCHGTRRGCLDAAEHVGMLFDWHAEDWTGPHAMQAIRRVLANYPKWEPDALRRFVLVMSELSQLPMMEGRREPNWQEIEI